MHFSLLFTVVVCCLISLMAVQGYIPESGTFMTRDGSECTWFDLRENHSNKLSLATACMCKDREGKAQSYGCQYTTEHMDWCDKLKTEQSREVLLGLVHQLEGLNSSCQLPQLVAIDCPQVILEREMLHKPNLPCVSSPSTQKTTHKEL